MPHTNNPSHLKPSCTKPTTIKRQIIEDSDGWAHVIGGRTQKKGNSKASLKTALKAGGDFSIGSYQYTRKTLEEIREQYAVRKEAWRKSEAAGKLEQSALKLGLDNVENVVVLGLGTFQAHEEQFSRSCMTQLAALYTILEGIGKTDASAASTPSPTSMEKKEIQIIQQDPAFTPLDTSFLASLNHTVVDDPEAYSHIGPYTLVYAIHCYPEIYDNIRALGKTPGWLIGNALKGKDDGNSLTVGYPRIQELYEEMEERGVMPGYGNCFAETVVYARKEREEEEGQKEKEVKDEKEEKTEPKAEEIGIEQLTEGVKEVGI